MFCWQPKRSLTNIWNEDAKILVEIKLQTWTGPLVRFTTALSSSTSAKTSTNSYNCSPGLLFVQKFTNVFKICTKSLCVQEDVQSNCPLFISFRVLQWMEYERFIEFFLKRHTIFLLDWDHFYKINFFYFKLLSE